MLAPPVSQLSSSPAPERYSPAAIPNLSSTFLSRAGSSTTLSRSGRPPSAPSRAQFRATAKNQLASASPTNGRPRSSGTERPLALQPRRSSGRTAEPQSSQKSCSKRTRAIGFESAPDSTSTPTSPQASSCGGSEITVRSGQRSNPESMPSAP